LNFVQAKALHHELHDTHVDFSRANDDNGKIMTLHATSQLKPIAESVRHKNLTVI